MRKGFAPLIIILVVAVLAVAGFAYFQNLQSSITQDPEVVVDEYQKVEIAQLVADPESWDGKKVEVTGRVINGAPPLPMCAAREKGPIQELKDQYKRFYTNWAIEDNDGNIIGVKSPSSPPSQECQNYIDCQNITFKATAYYEEIPDDCNPDILYKSIYLIGVDTVETSPKPLPPTQPSDK